jgi:hypothetical protein
MASLSKKLTHQSGPWHVLHEELIQQIVRLLPSALELSAAAQVCASLRTACAADAERRCRARICAGCDYSDRPLAELVTHAASCVGGWCRLLAGRENLLETQERQRGAWQRAWVSSRASAGSALASPPPCCGAWIVLWEIGNDAEPGALWCGVLPLARWLQSSEDESGHSRWPDQIRITATGGGLPGAERPDGTGGRFQVSGPLNDARSWWQRASIVGPALGELSLTTLWLEPTRIATLEPHGPGIALGAPRARGLVSAPKRLSYTVGDEYNRFVWPVYAGACPFLLPEEAEGDETGWVEEAEGGGWEVESLDEAMPSACAVFSYALAVHVTAPRAGLDWSDMVYHADASLVI